MLNTFENATGIVVDEGRLQVVSVGYGLREAKLRGAFAIENYVERPPAQLAEEVKRRIQEENISDETVVLGVPRDQMIVRTVELPLEVEENLDQVVQFQIEKYEPVEGESSFSDYTVIARDEKQKKIQLQLFLIPPAAVEEPLALCEEIGLRPVAVRACGHSLGNLLHLHPDGFPDEDPSLLVEATPGRVSFALAYGPGAYQSKVVGLKGGELDPQAVLRELTAFLSKADLPNEALSRIYFCGPLRNQLREALGADLEDCQSLFAKLELNSGDRPREELENMADALGLALSGLTSKGAFNLIPPERRVRRNRPARIPTLVLAAMVLLMAGAVAARGYVQNERLLDRIRQEVDLRKAGVDESLDMRAEIEAKQQEIETLREILTGNQRVLHVLRELTDRIPDDSYLESVTIQREGLNITGHSAKASQLLTIMNSSECLENVETRFIIPGANNKEKFRFEADIVECEPEE